VFLWLLFGRDNREGAAWLLAGLGCTDWIDGYLARRWNKSRPWKGARPAADRLLLAVGIIAIPHRRERPGGRRSSRDRPGAIVTIAASCSPPRRPPDRCDLERKGGHVR